MALSFWRDGSRRAGGGREAAIAPSGPPDNALDVADGSAIDLGDLGRFHAVLYQGADARELRPRNLARRRRLGTDRCLDHLATDRDRRRDYSQHMRFCAPIGGRSASGISELTAC
jgi:hypothetical protein